ncbi:MAG: isochorismatase family protein [Synergistaceae bacterium]|nr:isochorismatase family protein [Synergistaceae bacterium]
MTELLVVDCQYDFIDGSLACAHSDEAVKNIAAFINSHPDAKIYYSADAHSPKHCSYIPNGGTWPVHCQADTHGAEIHEIFYQQIKNPSQRPNDENIYYKGQNDSVEEYSAFEAKNKSGQKICDVIGKNVIVVGIASEFCVRESILALIKSGHNVEIFANCLAWVNEDEHKKNINELKSLGVKIS